jgi:hypothetical protein
MMKRSEERKKPMVLNKAFVIDDYNAERIDRVNEKINILKRHTDINNS